jgi:polysaccharide biosynthesis protein PelA
LWTGDCKPEEETLVYLKNNNIKNMNGGDTMFDREFNSYTGVAPLYRSVGKQIQVYTSATNENIYTNEWQGPFGGFRNVVKTFEYTESPRRICPVNVYYHFFAGEMEAALNALIKVFEWADKHTLTPIFGSRHIDDVHGFISTKLYKNGEDWIVKNNGALRTLRFENENRHPVVSKENNIFGYSFNKGRLYIHLGPKQTTHIQLKDNDNGQAYLEKANLVINKMEMNDNGIMIDGWSVRDAVISFKNLPYKLNDSYYQITYSDNTTTIKVRADQDKKIKLTWLK